MTGMAETILLAGQALQALGEDELDTLVKCQRGRRGGGLSSRESKRVGSSSSSQVKRGLRRSGERRAARACAPPQRRGRRRRARRSRERPGEEALGLAGRDTREVDWSEAPLVMRRASTCSPSSARGRGRGGARAQGTIIGDGPLRRSLSARIAGGRVSAAGARFCWAVSGPGAGCGGGCGAKKAAAGEHVAIVAAPSQAAAWVVVCLNVACLGSEAPIQRNRPTHLPRARAMPVMIQLAFGSELSGLGGSSGLARRKRIMRSSLWHRRGGNVSTAARAPGGRRRAALRSAGRRNRRCRPCAAPGRDGWLPGRRCIDIVVRKWRYSGIR